MRVGYMEWCRLSLEPLHRLWMAPLHPECVWARKAVCGRNRHLSVSSLPATVTLSQLFQKYRIYFKKSHSIHGLPGNVVRAMDLSVALSNKLAAWNERHLWRDVLDLWFLHSVRRTPLDYPTLDARLENVVARRGKPKRMTRRELAESLRRSATGVTREAVVQELSDTVPAGDLVGIEIRLATALGRLAQEMEDSEP